MSELRVYALQGALRDELTYNRGVKRYAHRVTDFVHAAELRQAALTPKGIIKGMIAMKSLGEQLLIHIFVSSS